MIKRFENFISESRQDVLNMANKYNIKPDNLAKLKKLDPSNGKFMPWLIKIDMRQDIWGRHWNILNDYHRHLTKSILPLEYRDINTFSDFDELEKVTKYYNKQLSRKEKDQIGRDGCIKVMETDKLLLLNITTYEASVKYGKGTRWCISSKGDSGHFDVRNENGTIFFVYLKDRTDDMSKLCIIYNKLIKAPHMMIYDAGDESKTWREFARTVNFYTEYGVELDEVIPKYVNILAKTSIRQ